MEAPKALVVPVVAAGFAASLSPASLAPNKPPLVAVVVAGAAVVVAAVVAAAVAG